MDLAGGSTEAELGTDAGAALAEADPVAIADALEQLLDDERALAAALRGRARAAWRTRSWDVAARQVEAGLREALREREPATESAPA